MVKTPWNIVADGQGWSIRPDGLRVTQCVFDQALSLSFYVPEGNLLVAIESPFRLRLPEGNSLVMDPEADPREMAPALALLWDDLKKIYAAASGNLSIWFGSGMRIDVDSDPNYEAWNIVGSDGLRLVAMPGGGLAEWYPNDDVGG